MKEVQSEAEKILHKTAGGLSLFERLQRDAQLRNDLASILAELMQYQPAEEGWTNPPDATM